MLPDELLLGIRFAQAAQHGHLISDCGHMIRDREYSAWKTLAADMPGHQDRFFSSFTERLAILIFNDNGSTENQHLQPVGGIQVMQNLIRPVSAGERGQ